MIAISCRDLRKIYRNRGGETRALSNISCDVYAGEFVILTGPPGSGKTTLLSLMGAMIKPDGGECLILEKNLFALKDSEKSRFILDNVGYLFQDLQLISGFTVLGNLLLPLQLQGMEMGKAKEQARDILTQVGLLNKEGLYPGELSQGERLLVGLARALVSSPKILLLDEPTLMLDHQSGVLIMTLLRQLVLDHEVTVVAALTDVRLMPFAHRLFKMKNGAIIDILGESHVGEAAPPYLKI